MPNGLNMNHMNHENPERERNKNQLRFAFITGDIVDNMYPKGVVIRQILNPETTEIQSQRIKGVGSNLITSA